MGSHEELSLKRDDCFEIPFHCPEKIPTRRFSSPNSPLPPEELDELQRCIEAANDLLRTLGNKSDPNNTRQLQLHFLSLQDVYVRMKIKCREEKTEEKTGILATAGRNFIQLNSEGKNIFILNERIGSLEREVCETSEQQEQELIEADQNTRRQMVLNFGDFVSKRPELVNLFFGNLLHLQLLNYRGKDVNVKTDDHHIIKGRLFEVDEGKIQVENRNGSTEINMDQICFLEVLNMK